MNYQEISDTAFAYADRKDANTIAQFPAFMKIVESRINRMLKTFDMSSRAMMPVVTGQFYYGLPDDFAGLRSIALVPAADQNGTRTTLEYVSPEQMNIAQVSNAPVYTLVANQVQINPYTDTYLLEIIYYRRLPPLTTALASNWLSASSPDVYVFGVMVEIMAYVKNPENATLWNGRFAEALAEITKEDDILRWSGTPLTVKVG